MSMSLLVLVLVAIYLLRDSIRVWMKVGERQSKSSAIRISHDIAVADIAMSKKIEALGEIPVQDELLLKLEGKRTVAPVTEPTAKK